MTALDIIDVAGKKVEEVELPDFMLQVMGGEGMIQEVVRMHQARSRRGTASTKTRMEVRSSGRKPWRQKGTGRARAGTRASPLWRGGGVIFGPRPRDFSFSVPKKVKRKALKLALASRFQKNRVIVIDDIRLEEPKTKLLVRILEKTGAGENTLIVTYRRDRKVHLAARNLASAEARDIRELNIMNVLSHKTLLITREALEQLRKWMEKIK